VSSAGTGRSDAELPDAVAIAQFKCHKTLVARLLNSNNKPPFCHKTLLASFLRLAENRWRAEPTGVENAVIRSCLVLCLTISTFFGCNSTVSNGTSEEGLQMVELAVVEPVEHLGHNIDEGGGHSVWCDGCRTRIVATGQPFVIYWVNNEIASTDFEFQKGRTYAVQFAGEMEHGVMGYTGKCIGIGQVASVTEQSKE
jgi:hypothetical protein